MGVFGVIGARKLDLFDLSQSGGIGRNGLGGLLRGIFTPIDKTSSTDANGLTTLIKYLKDGNKTIDDVFNTDELDDVLSSFSDGMSDKILEIGTASQESATQVAALQNTLGNTSKLKSFGNAVVNVGKSLLSSFANGAISAGVTWLVSTLAGAAISAIDKWIHRVENAKKAIDESIDSYQSAQTELKDLNKQLETTQTRMSELLAQDTLTLVEQDELEKLKETNDELERQVRIKEREVKLEQRKTLDTIVENYRTATLDTKKQLQNGYEVKTAYLRQEDGTIFTETFSVDTADEYEVKLKEIEDEFEHIKEILGGREFQSIQYDNLGDDSYTIAGMTKEQLDSIREEFGSIERFKAYYDTLNENIKSMRENSESAAYDMESNLLQYEQWLDQMDEVGYVNLNFDQKQVYDELKELISGVQQSIYDDAEQFTLKLKTEIDDSDLRNNIGQIQKKLVDSGLYDVITDDEKNAVNEWLMGLSENEAQAIADSSDKIISLLLNELFDVLDPTTYKAVLEKYLTELGRGGNVNLNNRPELSTKFLTEKGWEDAEGDYATLYTSTFSNEDETVFINFTPIMVDPETGKYLGTLTPKELEEYALGVINGTRDDDLNLQIGGKFTNVEEAENAANAYHEIHAALHDLNSGELDTGRFTSINLLSRLKESAKEATEATRETADAVQELQDVADETKAVDSMAKMETALASLGDLYDQVIKKPEDASEDFLFGFADPTTINSIESAFVGLIETVDDADAKEKLSYALRDFETTLVEFPDDAEAAQNAMDKLLTAYMDQIYGLDNVTEENKKWTIALLKNKGIVNAEEVIESRLDKTNKRLLASEKKLSAVFRDNADALDEVNKGTKEHEDALQALADEVNSMFSFSEDGIDFTMNIDADFVAEHLDLIRKVAAGDSEAIIELQNLLRQQMILDVEINSDVPQDIAKIQGALNGLLQVDLSNIEVGVDITEAQDNISTLISAFQSWLEAGLMSVDEINNAFASIGAVPDITETKPVKMTVDSAIKQYGLKGSAAAAVQQSTTEITVNMPVLKYKKANNGAFSKGLKNMTSNKPKTKDTDKSGGGNSGGGSDNKLQEDTKETYDWIEVKLKRLEEAYSSLDHTAGAAYESWEDRNNAIIDGLDIINDQIDTAEAAATRYRKERDNFTVDAPNKEDYEDNDKQYEYDLKQYQEYLAKKDEYKRKVENGQLLNIEDDIEYKSNKYIKEYIDGITNWNDKAIAADKSVEGFLDNKHNSYQALFDNVKTIYDGFIKETEDANSIIEEQITRTEEHGYAVSENYYKKQKALEEDRRKLLIQERNELLQRLADEVNAGVIKEGDEAYTNMTEAVRSLNIEIDKSTTAQLKFDKAIRQTKWDAFDWALERIDTITEETEFLTDLLDNHSLFAKNAENKEDGQMNERGWATVGLYGINYDIQVKKAQQYAEAIKKVQADIANDPNNKEYIQQKEELIQLQQESIKAAEQEKEAIKDLVEEAIQKHLS